MKYRRLATNLVGEVGYGRQDQAQALGERSTKARFSKLEIIP